MTGATRPVVESTPLYSRTPVEADKGVVAGGHEESARAGAAMLALGGSAVDALVAGAFAGMVAEPSSCGPGGWAQISVWDPASGRSLTFDGYMTVPAAARQDLFEIDRSRPPTFYGYPWTVGQKSEQGILSPAVPGAVSAFCDAHAMFGKLPLKVVLGPAIGLAEAGQPFAWYDKLRIAENIRHIERDPDMAAVLLPNGKPPTIPVISPDGDRIATPALATTLKRIAMHGRDGFYRGPTAMAIDRYIRKRGGILSADDLAAYRTRIFGERPRRYRGHDYTTGFDQVSVQALSMLDGYDLAAAGPDSVRYRHLMAEVLGVAYTDSVVHFGDPDFVEAPVTGLGNPDYGARRRRDLRLSRAMARPIPAGDPWPYDVAEWSPERVTPAPDRQRVTRAELAATAGRRTTASFDGTSQVVAADSDGMMAATMYSIGFGFGFATYVPEVGVFLNNSMKNFDPRPGYPNSIRPGQRPLFAAPALVMSRRGRPRFAGAGSGGYRVETGVLHALVNHVDHGMALQAAVDHPRVHCQGMETYVDARIPAAVRQRLATMGHDVVVVREMPGTLNFGRVACLAWNSRRRTWSAAAAPVWQTGVAGVG
ncbi:MAG: gamma-glutamyltransferase [Alphaproteobacteria bacterium]